MTLETLLASVAPLSQEAMAAARQRQAALAKPPESLGRLEELSVQLAGITGKVHNSMDKTHKAKLIDSRMAVRDGRLVITTGYQGDLALESASFEQKAAFFEEIFGIRPVLRQKRRV